MQDNRQVVSEGDRRKSCENVPNMEKLPIVEDIFTEKGGLRLASKDEVMYDVVVRFDGEC